MGRTRIPQTKKHSIELLMFFQRLNLKVFARLFWKNLECKICALLDSMPSKRPNKTQTLMPPMTSSKKHTKTRPKPTKGQKKKRKRMMAKTMIEVTMMVLMAVLVLETMAATTKSSLAKWQVWKPLDCKMEANSKSRSTSI
jgi:hypothetical protein